MNFLNLSFWLEHQKIDSRILRVVFLQFFFATSLGQAEWIFFENHLHSHASHTHSRLPHYKIGTTYEPQGIQNLISFAKEAGVRSLAITDHNTIDHWFDPQFENEKELILVRAMEWTNMLGGHATLFDFEARSPEDVILPPHPISYVSQKDYSNMIEEVHRRGGWVSMNHPRSLYRPHQWPDRNLFGADAIELNFDSMMQPEETVAWWERWLQAGYPLILVGGSDYHDGSSMSENPFHSINRIWIEEASEEGVMRGLKRGQSVVMKDLESPILEVDAHVVPQDYFYGNTFRLAPLQMALLEVTIRAGSESDLYVFNRKGYLMKIHISHDLWRVPIPYQPMASYDYVRFEIRKQNELVVVSNPFFFSL